MLGQKGVRRCGTTSYKTVSYFRKLSRKPESPYKDRGFLYTSIVIGAWLANSIFI